MLDPCSEAPYRRFLPSCEQNRATAASRKEKPVKRCEHLAGFRSDALNLLRTQHVYWARKESRTQSAVVCKSILEHPPKTPLRHGITAFSLNRKALAGPPLSPGQWAHGETGWWPFRGIGQCTLPGLQTVRRGRNVPTRSQRNRRNRALEGDQSSLVSEAERLSCRCRSNSAGAHRLLAVWQRRFQEIRKRRWHRTARIRQNRPLHMRTKLRRQLRHQRVRQRRHHHQG